MADDAGARGPGGVRLDVAGGVAVVSIDRPAARNAIGAATVAELELAVSAIVADDSVAVVVLTGGGDRAFVSGGDLKELDAVRTHDDTVAMAERRRRVLDRLADLPVPVIAALNGHAIGGGAEVALAADIRIAAHDVRIGFNQVKLGVMAGWGGAERLTAVVGRGKALLAMTSGELYPADAAHALGMIDLVVPRADFTARWQDLARTIAGNAPGANRAIKQVVSAVAPATHRDLEADSIAAFAPLWTADAHWDAVDRITSAKGSS